MEDSYKNRDWVDHPLCVNFASNIRKAFRTIDIPEEYRIWSNDSITRHNPSEKPTDRFENIQQIDNYVTSIISDQISKRSSDMISKNLVLTVGFACGIPEIRRSVKIIIVLFDADDLDKCSL